jgi:hypothetical protein
MHRLSPDKSIRMLSLRFAIVAALVAVPACAEDDDGLHRVDGGPIDPSDTSVGDTSPSPDLGEPEPDVALPGPNQLVYIDGQLDAAGGACHTGCFLRAEAGSRLQLAVRYHTDDGRPLDDRSVRFDTGDAPAGFASLNAMSVYTDAQGIARAELRSHGIPGSLSVTARIPNDPDAGSLTFVVTFDPRPQPDLAVGFEYRGRGPISNFTLRGWKQTAGSPSCAEIHPDSGAAKAPDFERGPFALMSQARVDVLPDLATDQTQRWTLQLIGPVDGAPYASGCVEGIVATAGATAEAYIYILDLPLNFRGRFETTTTTDMLSGGAGTPIGTMLITLTDLFTRPGSLIVRWACSAANGGTLGTVCNFLVNGSGELSLVGNVVAGFADQGLLALLGAAIGEDNQQAAQIISEVLRDLRFLSYLHFEGEPSTPRQNFAGAWFAQGEAREEWVAVRFRWKFDPSCKQSPNPSECGWTTIPMEEIYGHRPTNDISAGIDADVNLHVDAHRVPTMTYGPLISGIVERRLLSLLFATGTPTPVASWEDLVGVLFGDRECLHYDDCCTIFADRIYDDVPVWVSALAPAACEAAIPLVASVIRNQFASLDGALNIGTTTGAPCESFDGDTDRWVDGYGPQSAPCGWNMFFETRSGPYFMTNTWRAFLR